MNLRSLFNRECREQLLGRLRRLQPERPAIWGRMTAPQMLTHLCDQMRLTLGDSPPCAPLPGRLRYPILREAALYFLPWPKGRIEGPPEAFVTTPNTWAADLASLEGFVDRFATRGPQGKWPPHPIFGRMSGRAWGVFCYRHFDHHLRQFGA